MRLSRGRTDAVDRDAVAAWIDSRLPHRAPRPAPLVDLLGDDDVKLEGDLLTQVSAIE